MSNLIREDMKMEEKNAFIEVLEEIGEKRERIGALEQKIHYFWDHDNIETKAVTDVVALYVMADDSPDVCSNYECSAVGDVERTEVYVVPEKDFTTWFLKKDTMPEEGVKLYDSLAQNEKNDM